MISVRAGIFRSLAGAMAVIGVAGASAHAQVDPVVDERFGPDRKSDQAPIDDAAQRQVERIRLRLQPAYEAQFDRWVRFQFRTPEHARDQLENFLTARVRQLSLQYRLTDEQKRKLELAGRLRLSGAYS